MERHDEWFIYLVECKDGSLYCGCTNDIRKRIATHNAGKGAKYTQTRLPVKLVYSERAESKSLAMSREYEVKQLSRASKLRLCETWNGLYR